PNNNITVENPKFYILDIEKFPKNKLLIYDRAMRPLRTINDYDNVNNYWDGTINGVRVSKGTYFYVLDLGDGGPKIRSFISVFGGD
ncbi:MAG: gliding motility-associated C-terminal domain-containing protein, partial [Sphingobacteriaceae bacterium]|nr:gliding motility-associated C-terminal domain-containing protein [Sphingobacteriaceae bacterium]